MPDPREPLGRVFHEQGRLTVNAERERPFHVEDWDQRTPEQQEIDMRGGHAVVNYVLTENATSWGTSCTSCARILDSAYAETVRREAAEAVMAEVREVIGTYFTVHGNNTAASLGKARDLAEAVRQVLDRTPLETQERSDRKGAS